MLQIFKFNKVIKNLRVITRSVNFQTRNPPEPHFDRKRMLEVCKPIYLPETVNEHLTCAKSILAHEEKPHPYEVMLSEEVKENIKASRMILIYHVNSLTLREKNMTTRLFVKENMSFYTYNTNVMKLALEGTKYQALLQLFDSHTGVAFCPELAVNQVLKLNKKFSEKLLLLAGVIEDRFYSKNDLTAISQVMKRNVHGEMVQQLSLPATSISNSISHQTNLLSHYLTELSKGEK